MTKPTGDAESYPLAVSDSGMAELIIPAVSPGLYKINDGQRVRLAAAGSLNPIEFGDLRSTPDILSQLTNSTGGAIHRIQDGLPDLRLVRPDRDRSGKGWLGLIDNRAHIVTGLTKYSLVPPLLYMISILMILMITWWREGR